MNQKYLDMIKILTRFFAKRLPLVAVSSTITVICTVLIFVHLKWPQLSIDHITIALLGIAILPWLLPFLKNIKLGPLEAETYTESSTTEKQPAPPLKDSPIDETTYVPTVHAKKILGTLWQRQKQIDKVDPNQQWTFRLLPDSPEYIYISFLTGFLELFKSDLVALSPKKN